MAGAKVLLVDDDRDFTEVLAERMDARGLEVATADNGPAALTRIEETEYDAVILDLAMPGMDGLETLKRMLEKRPGLQVILLTGHATVDKGVEAVKLGAADFLEKPAGLQALLEKIGQARKQRLLVTQARVEEEMTRILREKGW